jgi:dienelactone hydrolase
MDLFDLSFEQLRDRYGIIVGIALIAAALAGLAINYASARPLRPLALCGLAIGVGLGIYLILPVALRFATPLNDRSGPFPIATFNVELMPSEGGVPVIAQIWYPAEAPSMPSEIAPLACAQATGARRLAQADARFPILLYAPGASGRRDENAWTSATLSSHGYVVVAIDDIEHDLPAPGSSGVKPLTFDFSSDEANAQTLHDAARKVQIEAEKALFALDRLESCASADWRSKLDFGRVGFFGFSFGGAVAAEASVMDKRIAAVANLDGWLFGAAASGALVKPYFIMNSDDPIPTLRQFQSSDPNERNSAALAINDLREEVRQASRPDGYWVLIRGSRHQGFTDKSLDYRNLVSWAALGPRRMKSIQDSYLLAFFEKYLRGTPNALLDQTPSPYREVERLPDSAHRFADVLSVPAPK